MNRRIFIKKTFWGLTGIDLFSGLYAWQIEPFWVEFVKSKIPIIVFDKKLEQYRDKILFPEKLQKAKEILAKSKLPER